MTTLERIARKIEQTRDKPTIKQLNKLWWREFFKLLNAPASNG